MNYDGPMTNGPMIMIMMGQILNVSLFGCMRFSHRNLHSTKDHCQRRTLPGANDPSLLSKDELLARAPAREAHLPGALDAVA